MLETKLMSPHNPEYDILSKPETVEEVSETQTTTESEEENSHPVFLVDRGTVYSRHLYSVSGELLLSDSGKPMNVYTTELKEAFETGKVRLIHRLKEPSYRYFITSQKELKTFQHERDNGAPYLFKKYYVYVDQDVNKKSHEYRSHFRRLV